MAMTTVYTFVKGLIRRRKVAAGRRRPTTRLQLERLEDRTLPTSVTGLSPATGPIAGGGAVQIYGSGFTGASAVIFGNVATSSFSVMSSTQIMAQAPAHAAGTVDVTVTDQGVTSAVVAADQYTYTATPPPAVTGVSPSTGLTTGGGGTVVIDGSGFYGPNGTSDVTGVFFGTVSAGYSVMSNGVIDVYSPPAQAAGTVDVTVTSTYGTSAVVTADKYTYTAPPPPAVTSVSPNTGLTTGGSYVVIGGSGFYGPNGTSDVTGVFFGTVSAGYSVMSNGVIDVSSPPAHAAGIVDVTVTSTYGTSAVVTADKYTYTAPPPPVVTSVSPNTGLTTGGGGMVQISGSGFYGPNGTSDVTGVSFGTVSTTSYSVQSNGVIDVYSPPAQAAGTVDVTVTSTYGTSAVVTADKYTYTAPPPPAVTSVSPNTGLTTGGSYVVIGGSGFYGPNGTSDVTGVFFGTVSAGYSVMSNGVIDVSSPPAHAAGIVDVTVTSTYGTSAVVTADKYTYTAPPPPVVTSVSPNTGLTTGGGGMVQISGSGFYGPNGTSDVTGVSFGTVSTTSYSVQSNGVIDVYSPPAQAAGTVDVTVTSTYGTSAVVTADKYTYTAPPPPAVTSVSPNTGLTTGGSYVVIDGSGFYGPNNVSDVTGVSFGTVGASSYSVTGNGVIDVYSPPAQAAGTVDVTVTSTYGTSAVVTADKYTYTAPPANLAVTLTASSTVLAGTLLTYAITVTNNGPVTAQNATLSDVLPSAVAFSSQSQTGGTTLTLANSGNTITDVISTLAAGASASVNVVVSVPSNTANGAVLTDAATAAGGNATSAGASASTTVQGLAPKLQVSLSDPSTAVPGGDVTYSITVSNTGTAAATGVSLSDTLPSWLSFVSQTEPSGPAFLLGASGNTITDAVVSLAAGASATFSVVALVNSGTANGTLLTDAATASAGNAASGSASASTTVVAQPTLTVNLAAPSTAAAGGDLTYSITVSNTGTAAATGVSLSDTLPWGTTYQSQSQTSGPAFTPGQSGNSITDTIGSLAPGASATIDVVALVNGGTANGTLLTDAATASAGNAASAGASASATVQGPPAATPATGLIGGVYDFILTSDSLVDVGAPPSQPAGSAADPYKTFQLFRPASDELVAQLGPQSGAVVSLTGTVTLVDDGDYNLSLQESGSLGSGSFTFSESGPVSFSLSEQGNLGYDGYYSFTSVVLTQTALLSWSLVETNGAGGTTANLSGAESLTATSLGTAALDAYFWQGFNWSEFTQRLLQDNDLNIGNVSVSALTVAETGGAESYAFNADGRETVSGTATKPLPDMLQSGGQSFTYSLADSFTYTNQGADTFTLAEQGSAGSSGYALSCVAYSETGNPTTGQPAPGYGFQYTEAGTVVEAGAGNQTGAVGGGEPGAAAPGGSGGESFQFNNLLTYAYAEAGAGDGFNFGENGSFGNGSFSLNCVAYNAQGEGSYALNLSGTETTAGTFTSQSAGGSLSAGNLFDSSTESANGTFADSSSFDRRESGQGTFAIADTAAFAYGSYGSYSYNQLGLTESAAATFAYSETDAAHTTTDAGSFTQTGAGATQNTSVSGAFTGQAGAVDTLGQAGAVSYALTETGALVNGRLSLSCYVYDSGQGGTFTSAGVQSASQTGAALSVQSGTAAGSYGAGYNSTSATSNYSFNSNSSSTSVEIGAFSQATYLAGAYASGAFALLSSAYLQNSTDSWSLTGGDQSFSSGIDSATVRGVGQSGPIAETYTQASVTTFTSAAADSHSQAGTDSYASAEYGSFVNSAYGYGSVVYQSSGQQSGATTTAGTDTYTTSGSAGTTTWSNQGRIGAYGPAGTSSASGVGSFTTAAQSTFTQGGNDAWSQATTASSSYRQYEAGVQAGGGYSLASVVYVQNGSDAWTSQRTDASATTGTDSSTAAGLGCLNSGYSNGAVGGGSYVQTSSDAYTASSADTIGQSGSDTSYQSERGTFAAGTFNFGSVVFQETSSQSGMTQTSGQSASAGTTALTWTSSTSQAGPYGLGSSGSSSLNSSTQSGQSNYSQTASQTYSQSFSANSTSTSYDGGTDGPAGYAFTSVSYLQSASGASYSQTGKQADDSGTDSWSGTTLSQFAWSSNGSSSTGCATSQGRFGDAYQDASSAATTQGGTGSSTLSEQGVYANGSYAYSSWEYDAAATQTGTNVGTSSSVYSGSGTDGSSSTGGQTVSGSNGFSNVSSASSSATSADTYSRTGSQAAGQTQVYGSSQSLHEAGVYALGSYGLSTIAYTATSTASQAQLQTAASADSGSYQSASAATTVLSGVSGGGMMGSFTNLQTVVKQQSASGTYTDQSASTNAQTGSASSTWTELGAYDPVHGYSYSSVVFQAVSATAGTLQSYTSGASVGLTAASASTAASDAGSGQCMMVTGAWNSNQGSAAGAAGSTGYQSGVSLTSLTEVVGSTQTTYEAGVFAGGSYAYTSVNLSSSSTDGATVWQDGTSTTSGTAYKNATSSNSGASASPLTYGAPGTATYSSAASSFSASASTFNQSAVKTFTQNGSTTSSNTEQGTFAGGSYAFTSTVYQYQANSSSGYTEADAGSFTGASADGSTSGNSSGSTTLVSGPPAGMTTGLAPSSYTNASSAQITSSLSANDSLTQSGNDASSVRDSKTSSYTVYEAGSSGPAGASLSSVVVNQSAVETTVSATTSSGAQSGSNASSGGNGNASFTQTSLSTVSSTSLSSSSLYEAGTAANGVYSFSSLVYRSGQSGTQTTQQFSTQSSTQGGATGSNQSSGNASNSGPGLVYSGAQNQSAGGHGLASYSTQTGLTTTSLTDVATNDSSYYAAGSYNGAANASNAYSLTSVNYQTDATNSVSFAQYGAGTATGGNGSSQGGSTSCATLYAPGLGGGTVMNSLATSQTSCATFAQVGTQTLTRWNYSDNSLSEEGTYANGCFALSSVVWDSYTGGAATNQQHTINWSTQTTTQASASSYANSGYDAWDGLPDPTQRGNGTNASSTTTTTYQYSDGYSDDYTFNSTDVYEAGSYGPGGWSLACVTLDQASAETTDGGQTSLTTQVVYQSLTNTNAGFHGGLTYSAGSLNSTNLAISTSDLYGGVTSYSHSTLHEAGSAANGAALSLGCVSYDASGLSSYWQDQYQTRNSTQTTVATGNQCLTMMGSPVGGVGTSTAAAFGNATATAAGLYSYTDHEEGTYGAGSFALSSTCYDETTWADQTYTAFALQTALTQSAGAQTVIALNTQSGSAGCWQSGDASLHAAGCYANGSWGLSSYSLTASNSLIAVQAQSAGGASAAASTITPTSPLDLILALPSNPLTDPIATVLGPVDNYVNRLSASQSFSGDANSLSQATFTSQSGALTEEGTYGGGSFALSLVSFSQQGFQSYQETATNNDSYTNPAMKGDDSSTVTASGQESYSLNAQGSWTPLPYNPYTGSSGCLSLSSYSLTGGSNACYNLSSSGDNKPWGGSNTSYSHGDVWTETATLTEQGTDNVGSVPSAGYAPTGWDFSSYNGSTASTEVLKDASGGNTAVTTLSDATTVAGFGSSGTSTETASGHYEQNGWRGWTLAPASMAAAMQAAAGLSLPASTQASLATAVALSGPSLPALNPAANPANWMLNPNGGGSSGVVAVLAASAPATGAVVAEAASGTGQLVAAAVPASGTATAVAVAVPSSPPAAPGLSWAPPALVGVAAGPMLTPSGYASLMTTGATGYANGFSTRGWLAAQTNAALVGANAKAQPWVVLGRTQAYLLQAAGKAAADGLARFQAGMNAPGASNAWPAFSAAVGRVHGLAVPDLGAQAGAVVDFVAGALNRLTGGLLMRFPWLFSGVLGGALWLGQTFGGMGNLVDTSSEAYKIGGYVGQAVGVALSLFPPTGALGVALEVVQVAGAVVGAGDGLYAAAVAWRSGNNLGALEGIGQAVLSLGSAATVVMRGLSQCQTLGALGPALGTAANGLMAGLGAVGVFSNVYNAYQQFTSPNGDPIEGTLDLLQGAADVYTVSKFVSSACFAAGTKLLVKRGAWVGWLEIEQIRQGDYVLSRPEGDASAACEWKLVEAVFSRTAPITALRLPGGKEIRTTAEHTFYARPMSDWLRAGSLEAGDELVGKEGEWTAVHGVEDTGLWQRVYNVQVADFHTYFVGGDDWDFSVWAHNTCLGGKYKDVRAANEGGEVHHMPSYDAVEQVMGPENANFKELPSIWMETEDHYKTESRGRGDDAEAWRETQADLIILRMARTETFPCQLFGL